MEGISGKRALVTGGAAGIGLGIAKKLLDLGAIVYIVDKDQASIDKALSETENKLIAIKLDITDIKAVEETIKDILPIQLLVNNAGIVRPSPILESSIEDFEIMMNTNVRSAIKITQIVAKNLISIDLGANIVNISSLLSKKTYPESLLYCCSKAALNMVTKCFAIELGSKNIRVNAVLPMRVPTTAMGSMVSDTNKQKALARSPQNRFLEISEVVNAVIYLLSDQSTMINGHCLILDGGAFLT